VLSHRPVRPLLRARQPPIWKVLLGARDIVYPLIVRHGPFTARIGATFVGSDLLSARPRASTADDLPGVPGVVWVGGGGGAWVAAALASSSPLCLCETGVCSAVYNAASDAAASRRVRVLGLATALSTRCCGLKPTNRPDIGRLRLNESCGAG